MADFTCFDIFGNGVSQFVFNDDGTVSGIITTGSTGTDPNTNPSETTYPNNQTSKGFGPTKPVLPNLPPFNQPAGTTLSPISEECCSALNFTWDDSTNTCYWSETCSTPDFKIVLGATGNDGAIFQVDDNETCQLEVKFDYLFQFDCDSLKACIDDIDGPSCLEIFEGLDVSVTLEVIDTHETPQEISGQTSMVNPITNTTVYEETLYSIINQPQSPNNGDIVEFFRNNCATGLFLTGSSSCVEQIEQCIISELSGDCDVFSACTLNSNWVQHTFTIADEETLSAITNEKIKLGVKINNCECDFNLLIDRIELNKVCTAVDREDIYIAKCPGFELERVCDNKKSWVSEETRQDREFGLSMRETDYFINDYRLAINSKEVDLEISPANAIETDMWCYIKDNPELLDCSTGATGTTSVTCDTDINFSGILEAQASGCTSEPLSGCEVDSQWGIVATLGCDTVYTNENFYVSSGLTDTPTQAEYVTELVNIGNTLGLDMITGATSITYTGEIDCEGIIFINKNLKIDLTLDITVNCDAKLFQDGEEFFFQDGSGFDFN